MKKLFLMFMLFGSCSLWAQDIDYFNKNKEYHYNAVYIDSHGDTITQEKMILKPLGRPWLPQPWLQVAIKYIYSTDTAGYKDYVDPDEYFHKRTQKYFKKMVSCYYLHMKKLVLM